MNSIEFSDLSVLASRFQKEAADSAMKNKNMKNFHTNLAGHMQGTLYKTMEHSGLQNHTGKVRSWQEKYVGSYGGYAAVRPINSSSGADSPGAITNYLERGFYFYRMARQAESTYAKKEAERLKKEIIDRLNG